jgi:adenylylsulfate kinase-like enzyme|tara:strand:- start:143 stop:595 length:453 start_codon:yes stop_codon:yes gene_type:complete
MIYWFTGQPAHGKTVLANKLKEVLPNAFRIDGDEMRELFTNKDYTINGRVVNVGTAQRIAHYLNNQGHDVIVSLVAPYVDQREDFKKLMGDQMIEFYVHTDEARERDHFKAIAYVPPTTNYVDVDTTDDSPDESFTKIMKYVTNIKSKNI